MDISETSNMFICITEARRRAGEDLEDIARELGVAFRAAVAAGMLNDGLEMANSELKRLTEE